MRQSQPGDRWIEVIGLDDAGTSHITRIKRAAAGDLYWFPTPGESKHLSRHASGEIHFKGISGSKRVARALQDISFEQCVGFGLPLARVPALKPYEFQSADAVFAIDLRTLHGHNIYFDIFLVSSPYIGSFFASLPLINRQPSRTQPFIFTAVNPWLVLLASS